jgi:hypothetical protein
MTKRIEVSPLTEDTTYRGSEIRLWRKTYNVADDTELQTEVFCLFSNTRKRWTVAEVISSCWTL